MMCPQCGAVTRVIRTTGTRCVCPDHLLWETKQENMARQWVRRRSA